MQPLIVIGAGPVGLAVAKGLGEAGLDYVQVEATDHVGGNWAHGVYTTAHIISSKKTTEDSDFPMPAHYPDFPSAAQMRGYFESYADAFSLRDKIRFDTPVISAHYVHLMSKGKERKVALIACAHKLLRILDAMVRHDEPWDASRHPAGLAAMAEEERAAIKNGLADLEAGPADLASEQPCKPATKPKTAAKGARRTSKRVASKPTAKPTAETLVASAPRRRPTRPVEEPKHGDSAATIGWLMREGIAGRTGSVAANDPRPHRLGTHSDRGPSLLGRRGSREQQMSTTRRTPRLASWNYSSPGAYLVTMVAAGRRHVFGGIVEGAMRLSPVGSDVASAWQSLPSLAERQLLLTSDDNYF